MTPERWQAIERLYHRSLELNTEERSAFLAQACGEDVSLRKQVESLLNSTDESNSYLETPAARILAGGTPAAPARLGRYRVTGEIGKGGMGAVYRGVDPLIGRTVAIKTILPDRQASGEQAVHLSERLRREARAAGALDHPNIVTVFDVGEEDGLTYIVMEFIEGPTLDELLRVTPGLLPTQQSIAILTGSARALDYAHGHGIVHRDVKPGNIMIRRGGDVKLTDFGIAKVSAATTLTAAGGIAGTPYFMSPEQLHGQEASPRSDQFSLAVVAWMLLTGSRPFEADQIAALLSSILLKEPPVNARLNAAVDLVLRRALEKDPSRRFESCGAFIGALQNAVEPTPLTPAAPPPVIFTSPALPGPVRIATLPAPRKHGKAWVVGGSAALAVAGLAFYLLRPQLPVPTKDTSAKNVEPRPVLGDEHREAAIDNSATTTTATSQPPVTKTTSHTPESTPKSPPPPSKLSRPPVAGSVKIHARDGLPYVWIPPGKFNQGCSTGDRDCADDEKPSHPVTLSDGFWIGQTETTVDAYRRFIQSSGRSMPPEPQFVGGVVSTGSKPWADGSKPIIGVTWAEAKAYCEWSGLRLPTEGEWEYAARAGDARANYGAPASIAWFGDNSGIKPIDSSELWRKDRNSYPNRLKENGNASHSVGRKEPNKWGLRDMLGNVWEWVSDWYVKDYYAHSPDSDPPGPASGQTRVLRGGSWYNGPRFLRVSQRYALSSETRRAYIGFRCAGKLSDGGTP